ncbi:hypothetical protein FVE85_0065 [Porphyridium purpureum]|uniref:Uncharacterized protein n=1 Tax=Porphyridium purpureum TaxID=35688 RepID=A0A5J4YYE3_PORPP|nr:hypothetical protein FVE85_0065 [Porphyridium purpureum]|eukprot:POR5546..scf208_2
MAKRLPSQEAAEALAKLRPFTRITGLLLGNSPGSGPQTGPVVVGTAQTDTYLVSAEPTGYAKGSEDERAEDRGDIKHLLTGLLDFDDLVVVLQGFSQPVWSKHPEIVSKGYIEIDMCTAEILMWQPDKTNERRSTHARFSYSWEEAERRSQTLKQWKHLAKPIKTLRDDPCVECAVGLQFFLDEECETWRSTFGAWRNMDKAEL